MWWFVSFVNSLAIFNHLIFFQTDHCFHKPHLNGDQFEALQRLAQDLVVAGWSVCVCASVWTPCLSLDCCNTVFTETCLMCGVWHCAAEILDGLHSENQELKNEHKKFRDIIERAGHYFVFLHFHVLNSVANMTFHFISCEQKLYCIPV